MDAANPLAATSPQTAPAAAAEAPSHGISFHDVLSALNPLQYLPVVGTIYRAITGDTIAEPIRMAGSLAVSGLMGGPVGMLLNLGATALEKLAGIDPDKVAHQVLAAVGLVSDPAPAGAPAAGPTQVAHAFTHPAEPPVAEAGDASDAARLRRAAEAYGATQPMSQALSLTA
jgi:hypothetical protein